MLIDLHPAVQVRETQRQRGRCRQRPDQPAVAQQQLAGVSGADPAVPAAHGVQFGDDRGDEAPGVAGGDPLVDRAVGVDEVEPAAAGVAVGADREGGKRGGLDAVADGVQDGGVQDVAVDRVVEGVPADVVAGFEDRADRHARSGEGQRRQQAPHDLGGELHRYPAAGPLHRVAVHAAGGHQLGQQARHELAVGA